MSKAKAPRSDSWYPEQDQIAAETILNTVRNGGTQRDGFRAVMGIVGRSEFAVAFRWNSVLRYQYEEELSKAKIEGLAVQKEAPPKPKKPYKSKRRSPLSKFSAEEALNVMQHSMYIINYELEMLRSGNQEKQEQISKFDEVLAKKEEQINTLTQQLTESENREKKLQQRIAELEQTEQDFFRLINGARKQLAQEEMSVPTVKFKMEPNGNLEREEDDNE